MHLGDTVRQMLQVFRQEAYLSTSKAAESRPARALLPPKRLVLRAEGVSDCSLLGDPPWLGVPSTP